jgi:cytochrome c556
MHAFAQWLASAMTPLHLPRRGIVAAIVLLAASLAVGSEVLSQEHGPPTPKDVIFARKILMDTINNNMDEIEAMIGSNKGLDLVEAREHADVISVMLMAFPHLFPASTNQWKPDVTRDPGTDTFASPDVWANEADFYQKAMNASKLAYNASRSKQEGDFKQFVGQLRDACNACHAAYQKND